MSEELTIFRDLMVLHRARSSKIEEVFEDLASMQDKISTILLCSKKELACYLTCDDKVLRELAEQKYRSYEE